MQTIDDLWPSRYLHFQPSSGGGCEGCGRSMDHIEARIGGGKCEACRLVWDEATAREQARRRAAARQLDLFTAAGRDVRGAARQVDLFDA